MKTTILNNGMVYFLLELKDFKFYEEIYNEIRINYFLQLGVRLS